MTSPPVMIRIFRANGNVVLAIADVDPGLVQFLLGIGILDGVDLNFVAVPCGNVDVAVDVVQFDAPIGCDAIGLVKLFGERSTMIGGMRRLRERKECAKGSQGSSQPSGRSMMPVHIPSVSIL